MNTNIPLQYIIILLKELFIFGIKPELKYDHSLESFTNVSEEVIPGCLYSHCVSGGWRWGNGKEMKRTNGAKTITRSLRSPLRAIKVSGQRENRFHCKSIQQLMDEKNSLTFCK